MDMKASSEEDYRNKLEGLSWNDLRKEVKSAGIPAKGNVSQFISDNCPRVTVFFLLI